MNLLTAEPRRFQRIPILLGLMAISFALGNSLHADLVIDLEDAATGAQFNGDVAGGTAGPFIIDGEPVVFTTVDVTGFISTTSFGLGLDTGGADPDNSSFNIGEFWTISADKTLDFTGLDIGGLQTEETFFLQSDDWINLAGVVPNAGVTYTSATGTFALEESVPFDNFSEADLTGGVALTVSAGTSITFGNLTSTFGPNDDVELQSMSFRFNAVPEPSGSLVLIASAMGLFLRRKRD